MTEAILVAMLAFLLGGVLKGAIGAGTPVIVIPIMSIYFDVPFAVAVFALPALVSSRPGVLAKGAYYMAQLRRLSVPVATGAMRRC